MTCHCLDRFRAARELPRFFLAGLLALVLGTTAAAERPEMFPQLGGSLPLDVAYSQDGSLLVTPDEKGVVVWDVASGRELRRLPRGGRSAVITPDNKVVAVGDPAGLRFWEVATGREIAFRPMKDINSVALSPDGRRVASASMTGGVKLWDPLTGAEQLTLQATPGDQWVEVRISRDGRFVVAAGAALKVWDAATGALLRAQPAPEMMSQLALTPDGAFAITGDAEGRLRQWDLAQLTQVRDWRAHRKPVRTLAISPDGSRIASGAVGDTAARIWSFPEGKELRVLEAEARQMRLAGRVASISGAAFSPDGAKVVTGIGISLVEWNVASGARLRTFSGDATGVNSISVSPDGQTLAVANLAPFGKPTMSLWDIGTGRMQAELAGHDMAFNSVQLAADGRQALTSSDDKTARLWDLASGKVTRTFDGHGGLVYRAILSPDGRHVFTAGRGPFIKQWDTATGALVQQFPGEKQSSTFMALSDDGKLLASVSTSLAAVTVWEVANPANARRMTPAHALLVTAAAFSPDGTSIITGSIYANERNTSATPWDRNLFLFDVRTGDPIFELKGHQAPIWSVAFSRDGQFMASGDELGKIIVWSKATGKAVHTLQGHAGQVYGLQFTPDGRRLASGADDGTARLWDLKSGNEALKMVHFTDGQWLAVTPEGYFSASSPQAAERINVRQGMRVYGINQFFDVFYRPDIVQAAMAGQDTSSMVALTMDDAIGSPPPLVEQVTVPPDAAEGAAGGAVKVTWRIRSQGGGIGEVRVFHNGKLVQSDGAGRRLPAEAVGRKAADMTPDALFSQMRSASRAAASQRGSAKPIEAAASPKPDLYEAGVDIETVPGDNEVVVVAFNASNTVHSSPASAGFRSAQAPMPPKLHILAIGIDNYRDKGSALKFAVKDAKDLSARWQAQAAAVYGPGNIVVDILSDAQASRAGILAKVDDIAARVRPTDHFMLFIASHGVLWGEQYYVVTSDYDGALSPDKLISSSEIVGISKRVKALSQLYILDTCHAGGVGGVVSGLYDARLGVLAKNMGLHVFASASSSELALDGFEGNGLFTHSLLGGLNNTAKADTNNDKYISLAELGAWAKRETRDVASGMRHRQDPLIINFGQDNAVYRLR